MFDGTDLSLAYGAPSYDPSPQFAPPPVSQPPPAQAPPAEPMQTNKASASHAMPPDVQYNPPVAMFAPQMPREAPILAPPVESFWERLGNKKGEIIKFVVLALVILLGISMDRVFTHYLSGYISRAFLTDTQEFFIRIGYPVAIILVLWIIKAAL
jgi:hypothetical protein